MKLKQYVIERLDNGLQVQWVDEDAIAGKCIQRTILFDTQEEAEEMMMLFPKFFGSDGANVELKRGIYYIDDSINYKDLKEREDFKKELENMEMARTLQEVLNTDLSAEKMGDYTPNELAEFLVKNGIVENTADVNRIVIEGIQKALNDDDEFPIHYYLKDEPMSEAGKAVDPGDCLTDEYIENNMTP